MSVLDVRRDRRAFTDALRPPAGFRLGAGVGTTFSLDFEVLTAALLALVGRDAEVGFEDHAALVAAVSRLKNKLRVFTNHGCLHVPGRLTKVVSLYDRILRPIRLPHGAFHPKVWVLRFDPEETPEQQKVPSRYRLLVASRNVTNSGCWELGVVLEGERHRTARPAGSELTGFLRAFGADRGAPPSVAGLIEELPRVWFKEPQREAAVGLRFEWQWPGKRRLFDRLPSTIHRVLLISPFLRSGFLDRLCKAKDLTIVSTQEELDRLPESVHQRLKAAKLYVVTSHADDAELPSLNLHAKLLAFESSEGEETLIGSANGTEAGWGCGRTANGEAMVALRPGLGINAIAKAFVSPTGKEPHPWIEHYVRYVPSPEDALEEDVRQRVEAFRRLLCGDKIRGDYTASTRRLRLTTTSATVTAPWPDDLNAEIVPYLQSEVGSCVPVDYCRIRVEGATFEPIDPADLAAFALIRIRDAEGRECDEFLVQFDCGFTDSRRKSAIGSSPPDCSMASTWACCCSTSFKVVRGARGERQWGARQQLGRLP
jgi:hypothetical protein